MDIQPRYLFPTFVGVLFFSHLLWRRVSSYLRLRAYPGPFIASLTDFWLLNTFWRNQPWQNTSKELHKKYGPIVRYGPNRLMFNSPRSIPVILSTSDVFEKAPSYDVLLATVRGREVASFIGAKPETRATALKKHVVSAFAPGHVLTYEGVVNDTMEILIQQLEKHGPVVEIVEWLRYFMIDTLSRIAFSEDLGFMVNKKDIDGTLAGAQQRFDHWHYWLAVPYLERLIFKNPIILQFTKPSSRLAALALRKIDARKQQGKEAGEFHDLLAQYLQAGQKDPEVIDAVAVIGLTISTIHAGADTTAATTSMFFEHILRHPAKLAKLEDELATAPLSQPPTFTELNKLPYLDACMKESMRLQTIVGDMLERVVGSSGAEIAGSWVPGGTVVTVSSHVVNRDESIWGSNTEIYNPDRWTEADEVQRRRMERSLIAFGAGKRMCLGQHIAWLEMKKLIPRLLTTYKISLVSAETQFLTGMVSMPKELHVELHRKESKESRS